MSQKRRTWKEIPKANTEKYKEVWLLVDPREVGRSRKRMEIFGC